MAIRIIFLWIVIGCCVLASAQDTAGWKTVADKKGLCQVRAPEDWTSPKAYINVVAWENVTFDQARVLWKGMRSPAEVFEDSPKRLWYAHDPKGSVVEHEQTYKSDWFVIIASKDPCMVEVAFNDPALTDKAKIVVNSLKTGK